MKSARYPAARVTPRITLAVLHTALALAERHCVSFVACVRRHGLRYRCVSMFRARQQGRHQPTNFNPKAPVGWLIM